jgi:hypothetical protein
MDAADRLRLALPKKRGRGKGNQKLLRDQIVIPPDAARWQKMSEIKED